MTIMLEPIPFNPVAVIPVYNHPTTIERMVNAVRHFGLPCILVDDGCSSDCAVVLDNLVALYSQDVTLVRLARNHGKGAAMMAGLRESSRQGYSHALQIDADGQHDTSDVPHFLALAKSQPQAIICGCPSYDDSVPKGRRYARYLTHIWVWINTLSLDIRDSMCGYRVYPINSVMKLMDSVSLGKRMNFDPEILVRLYWNGVSIINCPTRVIYPMDGISHFRLGFDNLLISGMHTKLFFGMILRLPILLWRKWRSV